MGYNKLKSLNIGIAVYNEARTLDQSLRSLIEDLDTMNFEKAPTIYICFNGCNDSTINKFLGIRKEVNYPIKILSSPKGKIRAHKRIINEINNNLPVVFIDADIVFPKGTLNKILKELYYNKRIIVSAYPYSLKPKNLSSINKVLYGTINIKRIYPKIEIARKDVSNFHPGEMSNFIKRSRIYFHGRCFVIRDKSVYTFPKEGLGIVGDDTFLSFYTLRHYAPGSIKILYDAKVYSKPQFSISAYLKNWFRIRKDLENIYKNYPEFKKFKRLVKMKINWNYVFKELPFEYKLYAILFFLLRSFELSSFFILSRRINADEIWSYKDKPGELK